MTKPEESTPESNVDEVYEAVKNLSAEERAALVKKLLGSPQESTFSFGIGGHSSVTSSVTADTMYQFNITDHNDVAAVLEAIASTIRTKPSSQQEDP